MSTILIVDDDRALRQGLDFAALPGDGANDGTAGQFRLVRDAIAGLALPDHLLAGDHDVKPRYWDAVDVRPTRRPGLGAAHAHRQRQRPGPHRRVLGNIHL